jgi:hypothetical protein
MDAWQPITEKDLSLQIEEELSQMPEEARQKFERIRTPMTTIACWRSEHYGEERLWVLGRSGNKLLAFDDVEEDFAIADIASPDALPLKHWTLFGPLLEYALSDFE